MAGLKEIKRRLRSVKNTKKITYAMKLVSAAKLRKAQDAVTSSRAYTDGLNRLLAALRAEQEDGGEFNHPLMATHEQVPRFASSPSAVIADCAAGTTVTSIGG